MKLHYRLNVHGREVITLDNSLSARRYAEQRFLRSKPVGTVIKWEVKPEGGLLLTHKQPGQTEFHTSAFAIEDVAIDD